ncbi:MAG TPA: serine/threonine-protein kinase [Pyrinomonadaceae bacterium]|nr:serine/threonine-protein kinase [Pyrinomonadaceae bacterium]
MHGLEHYVGHVLDDKYRLERLLGRGGMGAVYLATHLGTARYVALKLITPQFMRNEEFVERFKREARAAGRLRHPNVVDVTDFGFAEVGGEPVAYLVMEYLDGCTLGDVLAEEQRLPLEWVVDILEQVCSAVHEAHEQGIIHRDLKPDNIWLEPNRLGGYRVKVLDFGIAKLAELDPSQTDGPMQNQPQPLAGGIASSGSGARLTQVPVNSSLESDTLLYSDDEQAALIADANGSSASQNLHDRDAQVNAARDTQLYSRPGVSTQAFSPASTVVPPAPGSGSTAAQPAAAAKSDSEPELEERTLMFNQATRRVSAGPQTTLPVGTSHGAELTRVGAIMGTPLYMSPEQCSSKSLDARSDVYSLGVIAYQMLTGQTPFSGDMPSVMREHIENSPPYLRSQNKKIKERVANVVMSALAKDPADRPQTAAAFASLLRAQAEGIGSLYRRALALYSEHFPKFFRLSVIAHIPVIILTFALIGLEVAENAQPRGWGLARILIICVTVLVGLAQVVAYFLAAAAISGMTAIIVTQLSVAPLRPVELHSAFKVLRRRWKPFLKTAIGVTIRVVIGFILLVIPGLVMQVRYALYAPVVLIEGLEKKAARFRARELASRSWRTVIIVSILQFVIPMLFSLAVGRISIASGTKQGGVNISGPSSISDQIYKQLLGLVNIVIIPLMSIVPALLYLKMRQLGGERLVDAMAQIEEVDEDRKEWQQRMRSKLSLPTPRGNSRP